MKVDKTNKLAAALLEIASNEFSNHGCNDIDDDLFESWSDEDKKEFLQLADEWNRGPIEIESIEQMPDWMVMDVTAYILKEIT